MNKIFTFFFFLLLAGLIALALPQAADAMKGKCMMKHSHACDGSGGMMNHPKFNDHCDHSGGAASYPGAQNCCGDLASVQNNPSSPAFATQAGSGSELAGPGMSIMQVSTKPRSVTRSIDISILR
ncbi:MAG: hypothetical protein IEMM0002_1539 [bacterium]|nr:MAG: hypothetical protein IEMM0002_1539 [bacterium]